MLSLLLLLTLAAPPQAPPVHAPAQAPPVDSTGPTARAGYPLRTSGGWWTGCAGWQHMAQGEHRGKFPTEWLKGLTWAELQSLHSDDHEGRVKWNAVPGHTEPAPTKKSKTFFDPYCPTGT